MALYINEQTSSLADLLTKLDTFLTTGGGGNPGWTAEDVDGGGNSLDTSAGIWAISKTDPVSGEHCQVAFQWDTGTPGNLGVYQYHDASGPGNYNNGNNPWAQAADSGNGAASSNNTTLGGNRNVAISNSPVQYWCFAGDAHAHVVVQRADLSYRHFGFGVLAKTNDWTGGSYAYGYKYLSGPTTSVAIQARSCMLLDGLAAGTSPDSMEDYAATVRIEGMSDSPASGMWSVVMGNQSSAALGQDRQGTPRDRIHLTGGFRGGHWAMMFGQFGGTYNLGYIPTVPIVLFHRDRDISGSSTLVNSLTPALGYMPEVRQIMMRSFLPQDTVTIGADTWHIFPTRERWVSGAFTGTTVYQGIAYKEN